MKCQHCNFEGLREDARFCPKCGSRMEPQQEVTVINPEVQIESEKTVTEVERTREEISTAAAPVVNTKVKVKNKGKKGLKIALISAAGVLSVLLLLGALNFKTLMYEYNMFQSRRAKALDKKISYNIKALEYKQREAALDSLEELVKSGLPLEQILDAEKGISGIKGKIAQDDFNRLMIDTFIAKAEAYNAKGDFGQALAAFKEAAGLGFKPVESDVYRTIMNQYAAKSLGNPGNGYEYSEPQCGDLDNDGELEVVVTEGKNWYDTGYVDDENYGTSRIVVFEFDGTGFKKADSTQVYDDSGHPGIVVGKASKDVTGIFVECNVGAHTGVTDLLLYRNGRLENPLGNKGDEGEFYSVYPVSVADIDDDGIIEMGIMWNDENSLDQSNAGADKVIEYYKWDGRDNVTVVKRLHEKGTLRLSLVGQDKGTYVYIKNDSYNSKDSIHGADIKTGKEKWVLEGFKGDVKQAGGSLIYRSDDGINSLDIATGQKRWTFSLSGEADFTLDEEGKNLYAMPMGNEIIKISLETGKEEKRFTLARQPKAPAAYYYEGSMVAAGNVMIYTDDREELVAIDLTNGSELWSTPGGSVRIYKDRVIVSREKSIKALSLREGKELWSYNSDKYVYVQSISEGTAFIPDSDNSWIKINLENGSVVKDKGGITASASNSITDGNTTYYYKLYRFYAKDKGAKDPKWNFEAGGYIETEPVKFENNIVFVSGEGIIYCIDSASGREVWRIKEVQ